MSMCASETAKRYRLAAETGYHEAKGSELYIPERLFYLFADVILNAAYERAVGAMLADRNKLRQLIDAMDEKLKRTVQEAVQTAGNGSQRQRVVRANAVIPQKSEGDTRRGWKRRLVNELLEQKFSSQELRKITTQVGLKRIGEKYGEEAGSELKWGLVDDALRKYRGRRSR